MPHERTRAAAVDSDPSSFEYSYDANGNMIRDENKGLSVTYNLLNLPHTVRKDGRPYDVETVYDASGRLLTRMGEANDIIKYYCGPVVYEWNYDYFDLKYITTSEGRVTYTSQNGYVYEYHIKDHLGNTRVAYDATSSGPAVRQVSDYFPFGMRHEPVAHENDNKYLYNGKEFIDNLYNGSFDLGWYDYGARMYDPALGRWHVMDLLTDFVPGMTPYNYALDNPINYIDSDGLWPSWWPFNKKKKHNPRKECKTNEYKPKKGKKGKYNKTKKDRSKPVTYTTGGVPIKPESVKAEIPSVDDDFDLPEVDLNFEDDELELTKLKIKKPEDEFEEAFGGTEIYYDDKVFEASNYFTSYKDLQKFKEWARGIANTLKANQKIAIIITVILKTGYMLINNLNT